ncbi:TIGR00282 family metallophosphoesterase [Puniceicoccus vermicola]|uniref:YmdB family metallophosphoesterase n=1 Tax=Puniceicoccus vermicola TaxID=388746 RepID=A0A7X1E6V7_9BACT|nr:TIGR00282 family metallophosphoesterase [Puniceicoccus vermicola]MBC2603052.1 YmdB family metallophosphoesterase [Puniceicoccus vermicola]
MPRILFLGDIVGRPGRQILQQRLREVRQTRQIDRVIANGENAAAGAGITGKLAREILDAGVDAITLGDHVWDQRGFADEIGNLDKVCRPANLDSSCPGRTHLIVDGGGFRLGVFTVLGREFMKIKSSCPFREAERLAAELRPKVDALLVEIHAETTSEKIAMAWMLEGVATAVVGTHTHTPTADARVLPRGTAAITDVGMTGPYRSVLGREVDPVLGRFLDGMPRKFTVAQEDVWMRGVLIDFDETGRATSIELLAVPDTASEVGLL